MSLEPSEILVGVLAFLGLYIISLYNYLIFHSLAETFSIVIAFSIFVLTWNSRQFIEENYLIFIGIAYLLVGGIDFLHIFAYKGTGGFGFNEPNLAGQLWLSARYIESLSLLIAFLLYKRKAKIKFVFFGYIFATSFLLASIFYWRIFPDCFIEGIGLTLFKKISEYIICLILLGTICLLFRRREELNPAVFQLLVTSIIATIGSELALTIYIDVYGFSNLVGYFLKIVSFYLIYKAIIVTGLKRPYDLLFKNLKKSEKALRIDKDRVQKYLDIARVLLLVLDAEQKVSLINKKGCEILGYRKDEIIGKNWFDNYIPERNREIIRSRFLELMSFSQEDIKRFFNEGDESLVLAKNGEERLIEWHNIELHDEKGNIIGELFSGEDITERKKAERALRESEEKYHSIFETAASLIFILNADGIIFDCNQRIKDLLGYTKDEIIGHSITKVIYQGYHGYHAKAQMFLHAKAQMFLEEILSKGSGHYREYKMVRKDGTILDIMVNYSPLKVYTGDFHRIICMIYDITELKQAEEKLKHYATELKHSNEEIKQFAYIVSHDLRAPLLNLKGFAAELRSSLEVIHDIMNMIFPQLDEKRQQAVTTIFQEDIPEALGFIESSVTRMDNFINALLKLSRLGHCELKPEPVDMNAIVKGILKTLAHQIEMHQVKVNMGPLPEVVADRTSMEQIMGNILTNAVSYIDYGRPIVVEITAECNGEEKLFHIRDTGCGIAKEDMDKIFAPFRRAGKQDVQGEGMGLAYVQTLVRRHGGSIWCESEPGRGTTFSFTISNHLEQGGTHG